MSIRVFNKPAVVIGGGSSATLSSISISSNGTYSASDFGVDGFDVVDVDVQASATGGNEYEYFVTGNIRDLTIPNFINHSGFALRSFLYLSNINVETVDFKKCETIPASAFYSCPNLSFVQGSSVLKIGYMAFASCWYLSSCDFPKVKMINASAFADCYKLSYLSAPELRICDGYGTFLRCSKMKVNFPNLAYISTVCFSSCSQLNGDFPRLLGAFSSGEFAGCGFSYFSAKDFFSAGFNAFYNCSKMVSFITDGLYIVFSNTFQGCNRLKDIDLELVLTIGNSAFANCSSLPSFTAPLCSISGNGYHFRGCSSLSTVTLAGGNNGISASTFNSCITLESVYLLCCSILSLGNANAFANTPISNSALLGHYGSIYVPSSWVASYKTATNWATYSDRITALPSEFDSIYAYAFEFFGRSDLTEIPLSKQNVTYVCPRAFNGCTKITSINLPNCRGIGYMGFANTFSISTISLPQCVVLGEGAFSGQHLHISNLYFPKVRFIDNWAFSGCSKIQSIDIPECVAVWSAFFSPSLSTFLAPKLRLLYYSLSGYLQSYNIDSLELFGGTMSFSNIVSTLNIPNYIYSFRLDTRFVLNNSSATINANNLFYAGSSLFSCTAQSIVTDTIIWAGSNAFYGGNYDLDLDGIDGTWQGSPFTHFTGLTKLRLLKIPQISFAAAGFSGCINLSKVAFGIYNSFPESYFYRCWRLKSLYLLENFVVNASNSNILSSTPINNFTEYTNGQLGSIFVPARLLSDYQNHSVWSWFSSRFVGCTDEELQYALDHWND